MPNGDERSTCCDAPTVQDSSGDRICRGCGIIQDNYPEKKEDSNEQEQG